MNHAYCVGSSDGWKKMRFQLALNKTFFSNPQPLTHRRLKQRQSLSQSLGITLETFHFPETVEVFSNPTPITQSSINHQ